MSRCLVFGTGAAAQRYISLLLEEEPNCELAIFSNRETAQIGSELSNNFKIFDSFESCKSFNPDLAIICSVATNHLSQLLWSVNNVPCILVEKPVFASMAELETFQIQTTSSQRSKITVGYNLRFDPGIIFLKSYVCKHIGDLLYVNCLVGQNLVQWRPNRNFGDTASATKANGGGVLLELSHEIDLINWIFGDCDALGQPFIKNHRFLGLDVESFASFMLKVEGVDEEIPVSVTMEFIRQNPTRKIEFIFRDRTIDWDPISGFVVEKLASSQRVLVKCDVKSTYRRLLKSFLKGSDFKNAATFDEGVQVIKIIEKIRNDAIQIQ